jgi:hypothetical protein
MSTLSNGEGRIHCDDGATATLPFKLDAGYFRTKCIQKMLLTSLLIMRKK